MPISFDLLSGLIAHYEKNRADDPHFLDDHSASVTKRTAAYTAAFDPVGLAVFPSSSHDLAKASETFQNYVKNPNGRKGSVKHALPGAKLLFRHNEEFPRTHLLMAQLFENIIAGHHCGLYDHDKEFMNKVKNTSDEGIPDNVRQFVARQADSFKQLPALPEWEDPLYCAVLTRFIFSALVDADWLDTESYFNPRKAGNRAYEAPSFEQFQTKFHQHVSDAQYASTSLTSYRKMAERKGNEKGWFFELTLPTGYGKTFASLAFALEHAKTFNKTRVITVLPLINLTSEISDLYRTIFGEEHVIEDHSALSAHQGYESEGEQSGVHLATENYDRKFIVTTTVSLFESLFSNKPAKLRKIHRLAGSVLILDEFHLLPGRLLPPILKMLDILQEYFDVTVLVVSATPLPLAASKAVEQLQLLRLPLPLIGSVEAPRRVQYHLLGEQTEAVLLDRVTAGSTLIIVNTRKRAQQLYRLAKERFPHRPIYHLSTSMVAKERADCVAKIRNDLEKQPLVISTSLLEAGVDLSFQFLFREMAPLPSVIQAAGRCNRYGERDIGHLYLFSWADPQYSSRSFESGVRELSHFLKVLGTTIFDSPDALISYYKGTLDLEFQECPIADHEVLQFKELADKFQLIGSPGITVVCPDVRGFEQQWLSEEKTRAWWRNIQPYTARAPAKVLPSDIEDLDGVPVWTGAYDQELGILLL